MYKRPHGERISLLRRYEQECYQICYYLLLDEQLALDAARRVLLTLYEDRAFIEAIEEQTRRSILTRRASEASVSVVIT